MYYATCIIEYKRSFFPIVVAIMYTPYFFIGCCYWNVYQFVKMHNDNVSWQSSNREEVYKSLLATVIAFFSLGVPAHIIFMASILIGYFTFPCYCRVIRLNTSFE